MTVDRLKPVERGYNKDVVADLRELLARAEAGEILSLVFVAERTEKMFTFGSTGCNDSIMQVGMASRLVHHLQLQIDEREYPDDISHKDET